MAAAGVDYIIYDDDASFGEAAPTKELTVLRGDVNGLVAGKVNVIYFWAKWDKGNYNAHASFKECQEKHGDAVSVLAISCDPESEQAEGFLTKEKYAADAAPLLAIGNVAWDEGKTLFREYQALFQVLALSIPHGIIIDAEGNVVWHEIIRRGHPDCKFFDQVDKVVAGEPIDLSNGNKPIIEDDSDDSDAGAEVDDDFELF